MNVAFLKLSQNGGNRVDHTSGDRNWSGTDGIEAGKQQETANMFFSARRLNDGTDAIQQAWRRMRCRGKD